MSLKINFRELGGAIVGIPRYAKNIVKYFDAQKFPYKILAPEKNVLGLKGAFWDQCILPLRLNKGDLLWSPAFKGPLCWNKQIVTVHDLVMYDHLELYPSSFLGTRWNKAYFPLLWKNVSLAVIAVSHYTKQRLIEVCNVPESKIRVIYEAAEEHFSPVPLEQREEIKRKYGISQEKYVLSVATLNPRKNLRTLLEAWNILGQQLRREIGLVLTGMLDPYSSLEQLGLNALPEGVVITGYVDDSDLPALYSGASVFVYPSFYEGFGLPPLEAMACGTPVVVSNVTSMPEVCGNAAVYIDPYDAESLAEGLLSVLDDQNFALGLAKKGLSRAADFSWAKAASEHSALFREFL